MRCLHCSQLLLKRSRPLKRLRLQSQLLLLRDRNRRCHLAEFFDTDDAEGDRMDADRLALNDFTEAPDPCNCGPGSSASAPNAFVASLSGRQSR